MPHRGSLFIEKGYRENQAPEEPPAGKFCCEKIDMNCRKLLRSLGIITNVFL
jgi:hypothetical protein